MYNTTTIALRVLCFSAKVS